MNAERLENHTRQTNEIYQEYGRFLVEFEHVVLAMRSAITLLFSYAGLRDQQLSNIVLADQTAYPLKSILQAFVGEIAKPIDNDAKVVGEVFKYIGKLIEKRNDAVHATAFIGWASEEDTDFSKGSGFKLSRGKDGAGVKNFVIEAQEYRKLYEECKKAKNMVDTIYFAITSQRKISDLVDPSSDSGTTSSVST